MSLHKTAVISFIYFGLLVFSGNLFSQVIYVSQPKTISSTTGDDRPKLDYYIKDKIYGGDSMKIAFELNNLTKHFNRADLYLRGKPRQGYYLSAFKDTSVNGVMHNMLMRYQLNDTIGSHSNWKKKPSNYHSGFMSRYEKFPDGANPTIPNFMEAGWSYLGFYVDFSNNKKHFGYIKVKYDNSLTGTASVTIDGYGMETQPNTDIVAGLTQEDLDKLDSAVSVSEQNTGGLSVKVYPNPSTGDVFILNSNTDKEQVVYVLNISGAVVKNITVEPSKQVMFSDLPKGYYTVVSHQNEKYNYQKLIIQ